MHVCVFWTLRILNTGWVYCLCICCVWVLYRLRVYRCCGGGSIREDRRHRRQWVRERNEGKFHSALDILQIQIQLLDVLQIQIQIWIQMCTRNIWFMKCAMLNLLYTDNDGYILGIFWQTAVGIFGSWISWSVTGNRIHHNWRLYTDHMQ